MITIQRSMITITLLLKNMFAQVGTLGIHVWEKLLHVLCTVLIFGS